MQSVMDYFISFKKCQILCLSSKKPEMLSFYTGDRNLEIRKKLAQKLSSYFKSINTAMWRMLFQKEPCLSSVHTNYRKSFFLELVQKIITAYELCNKWSISTGHFGGFKFFVGTIWNFFSVILQKHFIFFS